MIRYNRVVLKISGEAISSEYGVFDIDIVKSLVNEIRIIYELGVEIGIVIGGGNIMRGGEFSRVGFDRNRSDYMGMLATLINSLLLEQLMNKNGVASIVQSALPIETVVESIDLRKTMAYLSEGKVVIFAAGTGSPHFTTDTAAALRAREINADLLLKATKVSGVYDKDPVKYRDAVHYPTLTYEDVLSKNLAVMDMTAISLCREEKIPIVVFNIFEHGSMEGIIRGKNVGTIIKE